MSRQTFADRVLARTGVELALIPYDEPEEIGGAHILCHDRETNTYVVFVGYSDYTDEDGIEHWPMSALRQIVIPRSS